MMNCNNCKYRQLQRPKDGHCYMFKEEPKERCYQFIAKDNNILKTMLEKSKTA